MKHGNISVFVPHNGCPHQCSFCSQKSITGVHYQPTPDDVDNAVNAALSGRKLYDYEIAFFGGSFTAIDRDYMISLLRAAYKYVQNGTVTGIRLSTRPDAISREILEILKSYGVTAIELGAQSMCDDVLEKNMRGHTADDVVNASRLIKEYGFSLGLQMMTGLYGSSREKDICTAERIISLSPDTVRIYPTVTIRNTVLGRLFESGEYVPDTLAESVELCAFLLKLFMQNNIEVIRLGLHYSEELDRDMLSDNYHPAFRELCENKLFYDMFLEEAKRKNITGGDVAVTVSPCAVSKFVGQKRSNIINLSKLGYNIKIVQDVSLPAYRIKVIQCC